MVQIRRSKMQQLMAIFQLRTIDGSYFFRGHFSFHFLCSLNCRTVLSEFIFFCRNVAWGASLSPISHASLSPHLSCVAFTPSLVHHFHPPCTTPCKIILVIHPFPLQVVSLQYKQDLKKCATDLVCLTLFQEQRHMPLCHDGVSEKVIGLQRGMFKAVFEEAQKILCGTFGMELIELPTCTATHNTAGGATGKNKTQEKVVMQNGDEGARDRQAVTGLRKKGVVYVLRLFAISPLLSQPFE